MAEESSKKDQILAEEDAVKEATDEYNDLIAILILIATSNRKKQEKLSMINQWRAQMLKWNDKFSTTQSEDVYRKFAEKALKEAEELLPNIDLKKKTLPIQEEELKVLSEELKIGLNRRLETTISQARELVIQEELERIRLKKLGMKDASDRIQLTKKKSISKSPFKNKKGKIVNVETVMRLTVGDQIWTTITSAQRSQWLLMGFKYGQHISVIDNVTTIICRALHLTRRDLTKDQLPPMHPVCRSRIKLLKEGWNFEIFEKNFGKK